MKKIIPFILSCLFACSSADYDAFSKAGSSMLVKTGAVSGSQADALFALGGKINSSAEVLSDEQEYYLGRGVSANILGKYKPLRNESINSYLTKVANVVAMHSEKPETFIGYKVQVLDSDEINAVSAPGGFIFVSRGFLKIIEDEESLAGLLAHEVSHIVLGHGKAAINSAQLTEGLIGLGKAVTPTEVAEISNKLASNFNESVDDIVTSLMTKGYSRSQEYEADEYAVKLLAQTGYNPRGLNSVLESLEKKSAKSAEGGWNSTHPDAHDRISELKSEDVKQVIGELERKQRFSLEIAKLN